MHGTMSLKIFRVLAHLLLTVNMCVIANIHSKTHTHTYIHP